MKQVLSYKNKANIPMMTAFREQVAYVFRIHLIQQIVENYQTRFTVLVAEILGIALVKTRSYVKRSTFRGEPQTSRCNTR